MVRNKIAMHLKFLMTIIVLFITLDNAATFAYVCCLCNNCKLERKEADELIRLTKFDRYNNLSSYLPTQKELGLLLNPLVYDNLSIKKKRYEKFSVEETCHERYKEERAGLEILLALVRQSNISQQITSDLVIPSLEGFIEFFRAEDTLQFQNRFILDSGRRALWCAEQYILNDDAKNMALLAAVESNDNDLRRIALDMLSDIDGNFGSVKRSLLRIKEKREKQGLREAASRIQYCVKIIEIRQTMLVMDYTQKNTYLKALFDEYVYKKRGWGTHEFVLWLITQFKLIGDNSSILSLKDIWNNESFYTFYRSAAQEALIYLEAIAPEERTLIGMD